MTTGEAPQPPKAGPRGRSHTPGVYAGRYLTKRKRARRDQDQSDRYLRRALFLKGRDVAYRQALGIRDDEALPVAIGQTSHNREPLNTKTFAA